MTDQSDEHARLLQELERLREENERLKENARLIKENTRLKDEAARLGDETTRMAYQQAADWVKTANAVTWSLGSIYVVAAIIGLNGAVQQTNQGWRTLIGLSVAFLITTWVLIDFAYLRSARAARKYLINIEGRWPNHQPIGFFTYQYQRRTGVFAVTVLLYATAVMLVALALLIAFPSIAEFVDLPVLRLSAP